MKILHTSDWHLGQSFMGQSREGEHRAFFSWLLEMVQAEKIDVLIVAGDIFDTGTPPNYALELYYNFLRDLSRVHDMYIIITAGNHDSVSTLKAPKQLLEALNVFVITSGDEDENELIKIYKDQNLEAVICAVPFLRDSVVRQSLSGKTISEKESLMNVGIKQHYEEVYQQALELAGDKDIPVVATGHLTTVGSRTSESERDIYIGGTLDIGGDFLGKNFDYVALGHLHSNQIVEYNHVRYSGSPIPLSFSEAETEKKVNIVTFEQHDVIVRELNIPTFRTLKVLKGNLDIVNSELEKMDDKDTWIEVHIDDDNPAHANQVIREKAAELGLILLAVKVDRSEQALHAKEMKVVSLDELTVQDVFEKRLELEELESEEFKQELTDKFAKVVQKVELV